MTTTSSKVTVLYNTKFYEVHRLEEQLGVELDAPPLSYSLYNKRTDRIETYSSFLPAAIEMANGLSDKLGDLLPPENIIQINPKAGDIVA